jgi:Na+-translocating ferredoxin:NAD+ oxidoreductase RnfA subunit
MAFTSKLKLNLSFLNTITVVSIFEVLLFYLNWTIKSIKTSPLRTRLIEVVLDLIKTNFIGICELIFELLH